MEIKRGDVVIAAAPGDYGKPRPAVVVQSDLFNATHASVVVCPITSLLIDAPLFRLNIAPGAANGIKTESQIMIDRVMALKRERIRRRVGRLSAAEMSTVNQALQLWLGLEP
jgi:mRNA interferase MazF